MNRVLAVCVSAMLFGFGAVASADEVIARYRGDIQEKTPKAGWEYLWNPKQEIGGSAGYSPLVWNTKVKGYATAAEGQAAIPGAGTTFLNKWSFRPGKGSEDVPGEVDHFVIASYTVPEGKAGHAWLYDGSIMRNQDEPGAVDLRVYLNDTLKFSKLVEGTEQPVLFSAELGEVKAGDRIFVAVGPDKKDAGDNAHLDYCIGLMKEGERPGETKFSIKPPTDQPLPRGLAGGIEPWFLKIHQQYIEKVRQQKEIGVLFIGDSITAGWASDKGKEVWNRELAGAYKPVHIGIGGDMTQHVLWRIANGELDGIHPKVVVLLIGTNNNAYSVQEITTGVTATVKAIREKLPESKLLLMGIFPRGEKPTDPLRIKMKQANEQLAKLDDGKMVRYLDLSDRFIQPDGTISKEVMYDFLHPGPKGYQIWFDGMRPLLDELYQSK